MGHCLQSDFRWVTDESAARARRLVEKYGLSTSTIAKRFQWDTSTARRVVGDLAKADDTGDDDEA